MGIGPLTRVGVAVGVVLPQQLVEEDCNIRHYCCLLGSPRYQDNMGKLLSVPRMPNKDYSTASRLLGNHLLSKS